MENRQKMCRLFFALWPSVQVRQSIVDVYSSISPQTTGQLMHAHNLHETLHFIGQTSHENKDCMHIAAQSVDVEQFQLELNYLGQFSKAKILWMGANKIPQQLTQLHQKLGIALEGCGFKVDTRPFMPHVTLLKKYIGQVPERIDFSIPWQVEEFVMVESVPSEQGVNYQVVEKYPLV
ncbi:MAG: RNA 2',3'-cyclic phosphodiesterase [Gammaproteobacteria bacterium]|nr:RNA 2',3'-cyclic phosphodiesterase [Gammaproteobacteria bacterium]